MTDYRVESWQQLCARTGGALYLALIVLGAVAQVVRGRVIVPTNPAAAAAADHLGGVDVARRTWRRNSSR